MNRKWELGFVAAFVVLHLAAPLLIQERFPFTISPMFCDQPSQYATYEVNGPDGKPLDLEDFGLHLVYDGNPPGLGMGIEPEPTLHPFGECCTSREIYQHVQDRLKSLEHYRSLEFVTVRCNHVKCEGHQLESEPSEIVVPNPLWDSPGLGTGSQTANSNDESRSDVAPEGARQ